jgi:tRNA (cmo5U34)-methyltransferase
MEKHHGAIAYNFDGKSTVEEIRATFDRSVDRFSSLETGQQAAMDSRLIMERIAAVAARTTPHAKHILDIGCGAGNYTLALLKQLPDLACTLLDLSAPMLERAKARVQAVTPGTVTTLQGDIREVTLGDAVFDVVLTGSALHHLRQDDEWEQVFTKQYFGQFLAFETPYFQGILQRI